MRANSRPKEQHVQAANSESVRVEVASVRSQEVGVRLYGAHQGLWHFRDSRVVAGDQPHGQDGGLKSVVEAAADDGLGAQTMAEGDVDGFVGRRGVVRQEEAEGEVVLSHGVDLLAGGVVEDVGLAVEQAGAVAFCSWEEDGQIGAKGDGEMAKASRSATHTQREEAADADLLIRTIFRARAAERAGASLLRRQEVEGLVGGQFECH